MRKNSKKAVALILSVCLLLSCMFVSAVTVSAETSEAAEEAETVNPWDGTADSELSGSGTAEDPYLITNAGELYYAVTTTKDYHFRLENDIIINDVTVKIEDGVGVIYNAEGTTALDETALAALNSWHDGSYKYNSSSRVSFKGTLDGNGHIVRGLYLDSDTADTSVAGYDWQYARALIPYVQSGTAVKNLGLEDVYVNYNGTASAIIGGMNSVTVTMENCYVDESAYMCGYNTSAFLGSGSQTNATTYVKNCYSQATLNGSDRVGAVFADLWVGTGTSYKFTVENVYATAKLSHTNISSRLINCYASVSAAEGYIGTAFDGNTFRPSDAFVAVSGELPTLKVFKGLSENIWGGLADSDIEGAGTSSDPYLITTGEELAYVMANNGDINADITGEHFKLANDIYLNNIFAENWKENTGNNEWYSASDSTAFSGMQFAGNLDGNGYCIYGIWMPEDNTAYAAGLVPGAGAYTVKNVGIKEAQIAANYYAGGIIGYCSGSKTTVSGCFTDSTVDVTQNKTGVNGGAGGIIGYNMGGSAANPIAVENCWSAANCKSLQSQTKRANGIIGTIWNGGHKVINCYVLDNAPYYADSGNRVSTLALDTAFVKYTDADGNEISGVPTDQSTYKKVYVDYTDTYTWNTDKEKYTSSRKYTSYSKLDEAYVNNYGSVSKKTATSPDGYTAYTCLDEKHMTGADALGNMTGFDEDIWYAVKDDNTAPMHRIHGTAIGDVNEDGIGLAEGDDTAERLGLIGAIDALNGDYNRDGATDILDLVSLTNAKNALDATECVHVYKETVLTESTVTVDGISEYTCRRCGHTYTENIGTSIKLLAIGSSHTMNSITYFGQVCEAAGIDNVYLGHMYRGGVTFQQQYEDATGIDTDGDGNTAYTFTYRTYEDSAWSAYSSGKHVVDVIDLCDWDYIVINQGAIDAPMYGQTLYNGDVIDTYDTYFDWEVDYIKSLAPDATLCWNMTFACEEYEEGDPRRAECDLGGKYQKWFNFDSSLMFEGIVGALNKYVLQEEEIEILLPSATTIENIRTSYKGHTLTNDLTHLDDAPENLHGRYAVALTWYKAITGDDIADFTWVPEDNLTDDLSMIKEAVNNAISAPLVTTQSTYTEAP